MRRRMGSTLLVGALLWGTSAASLAGEPHDTDQACPAGMPIVSYEDVPPENVHQRAIHCATARRMAHGTAEDRYSPAGPVTRGQMASFLARTMVNASLEFEPPRADHFSDDDGTQHEEAINQLADAGIALGDGDGRFRPNEFVTRAQMATFIHRTHDEPAGLPLPGGRDHFRDDDGSPHEASIDAVAEAGIAVGGADGRYRPAALVRRDQMASFLVRFLDVLLDRRDARWDGTGTVPPLPTTDAVAYQLDPAHTGTAGAPQRPSSPLSHAWTSDLGGEPSYPLIVGDTVFVVARGEYEGPYSGATLYALDARDGAVRWQAEASPFESWAAHAYAAGRVFTIHADGGVRAFDAGTGAVQWTRDLPVGGWVVSPPAAAGDALFVTFDDELLALDAATGETRWGAQLGRTLSAATVTEEAVFVSSGCHGTYAFTRDGREGGLLSGPGGPELLWHHEPRCSSTTWQHLVVSGGRVYSRTPSDGNLVLDAATGAEVSDHPSRHAPAFLGDTGFGTDARQALVAFDVATGEPRWRKRAEARFATAPIVASGAVYAATLGGEIYAFDPETGDGLWARVGAPVLAQYELDTSRPPGGLGAGRGLLAVPTTRGLVVFRTGS